MKLTYITFMMRRVGAVALLLFLCTSAFAFKDGSYTFSVNSDGESVTITSHDDKNATSIWIPSTAYDSDKEKSYDVTAIGSNVFRNYLDLTSITFLASIEYIGQNAFSGCLQLEEFYVPSSVKTLATGVFQGCRSLHSVTLNAGLINLGEISYPYTGVFEDCSSLKEVKLPGTVKTVGNNTFSNCVALESVDLNYGLLTIGSNAFNNCSSLTKIVIPNTVQEIGNALFQGCNILEDATIGSKVQSMGSGIFSNCNSLNKVTIENGCSILGQETFSGCSSLKTIVIPGTVKYINMGAFRDCTSLESVILNEGILYIGENSYPYTGVFQGCNRLKSIKIPTTVINICRNAFYGCTSLESAELSEGLQTISNYAFYNCSSLKSIVIPNTVETVGEKVFVGCSNLASAVVGRKVSSMGDRVFQDCKSLTSVTIEDGCSIISEEAFAGCIALPNVSIPGSVQNINMGAFRDCTSLESVILNEGILYIGENSYPYTGVFQGCNRLKSIKIPTTVINICRNAFYGCTSLESAELSEGLQTISNYAFYNCSSLKSIVIPNTVETVGEKVFVGCSNLASAVVGRKVSSMGDRVFQDCKSLTSVTIEDGCSIISEEAFAGCIALPNVSIPGSVQNINMGAFRDCTSLESVILNEGILYIGENSYPYTGVFQGCNRLKSIKIPTTVINICRNAFYGCTSLESAELSEGLQTISNYAFYNCSSLKSIVIPNTVETVGEKVFVGCSNLASAVVGRKVSSMGDRVFQDCKSLTSVTIEDGCSIISEEAFAGCIALPNVSIPGSVQNINMGAFRDCTSLESVILNEGILYIGENSYPYTGVFQGCNRLKSIKIPTTVINICRNAFYGCTSLESAELSEGLQTISNYAFYNCSSLKSIVIPNTVETVGEKVFVGCSNLASAVVGRKVSSMGDRVFQDCKSLTSVTIEDGCSIISEEAFAGCIALPNVSIPGSVQNINMGAFRDCTSLESVILNEGILYIGENSYPYTGVFQGCTHLSFIYIPSTIKSIKNNTFYGCANLRRFISNASIVPELSDNVWANSSQARATLYVPFDALADYMAAAQWQDFKNIRMIGDEGGEDIYGTCDLVDVPFSSPYFDAVEFLCERGVLNGSGMDGRVSVNEEITRAQMAKVAFWGLYLLNGVTIPNVFVSTLFPTVYQDLNKWSPDNDYYYEPARALLYLDYGDGVTPFDRNRLSFNSTGNIARIHVLKVLMETFNIAPNVTGTNNPFPDDKNAVSLMNNDPRKFGYLRKAAALGIVSTPNNGQNTQFRPYDNCTRGEAFLMLYRIMQKIEAKKIDMPVPDEKAYFEPLNLTLTTLARGVDFQMGNFNHYTKSSFDIDGTVPLTFSHAYNSYNTSIDDVFFGHRTTNNVDLTYRPLGPGWSHSYDCFVNLITTGNEERAIVHWGSGKIHVYKKENGKYVRESIGIYDELTVSNNEATIKDKSQVVYKFKNLEGDGTDLYYLTSVTDRNDNTLTIDYLSGVNGMKVINTVSDGSRSLSFKYLSGTNLLESVKDPLSREIKFGYTYNKNTAEYQLTSFTDAKGQVTKYTYGDAAKISTSRLMARIQLPKGNYVENEYDMNRRLSKTVSGQNNKPTTETSLTVKSQYTDTSIGTTSQIQVMREGKTSTFNYVFNENNSITNMTGEEGYEVTNSYTDNSNPHLPTAVKSNSSDVEDIKYDDRGNITSVTVKSLDGSKSRKVTMTYSTTNDLLSTTDAMGYTTNYTYDDRGNLVKVEQPEGVTSTMEVNAKGLVTKTTDPMGVETKYEYNGYGNVTKILLTSLNLQTRLEYDLASRITAAYDPLDHKQTYTYDNNDNLLTEVDPLNNTTKYGYDKNDNLTTVTNAKGNTTTMTYDNATDWLLSVTFGSSSEKYEYNKDGTLKTFIKPDGTTMSHTYDNLGRVLSDGANTYAYDSNMRLTTIGNSSSTLDLSYDGFNRLTKVDFSGGDNNTVKYEYNDNNSITGLTYPSGNKVKYEYDKLNRMTKVTDWKGNTVKYTYRKDSKLSQVDYSNGMSTVFQYDNVGRLIDKTTTLSNGTVIAGYAFELDKVGNILSQEFTEPYDSAPLDDESVGYSYNNMNRITKAGDIAFAFDANGNTTQRGDETYEWNSTDRLTRAASVAIEYDPYGLIRSYGDTKYAVDILGDGNVLSDSKTGSSYIYGQGLEMRISKNGEVSYYVTDVRGSVVAIVDASGNITHKYLYDDFGKVVESEEKDFNPFRYVGKYGVMYLTDHQYYMRARHYDPTIGRFLSEDPIWSTNLYPYADNNPIMGIDPRGEYVIGMVLDEAKAIGLDELEDWSVSFVKESRKGNEYLLNQARIKAVKSGGFWNWVNVYRYETRLAFNEMWTDDDYRAGVKFAVTAGVSLHALKAAEGSLKGISVVKNSNLARALASKSCFSSWSAFVNSLELGKSASAIYDGYKAAGARKYVKKGVDKLKGWLGLEY